MIRRALPIGACASAAALLVLSLAGCVSLFPATKPVQLYRFGVPSATASAPDSKVSPAGAFRVLKAPTGFPQAAAGDQIMTVSPGGEVAYIAGSRWVSAASLLFDDALERAFEANPGPARLIARGEVGKAALDLKLNVRTFEADYLNGPKSAPTVKIEVRTLITRTLDRSVVSDQVFSATALASEDRVSAITTAYDRATNQVLAQIIGAVNAVAPPTLQQGVSASDRVS
ncbi:MAG: ABC-type transport auxiliary lipoprotein family protein [Alphaproteobacteria bacterium]|jgi:cholesterol transport system auxiliary component